MPDSVVLQQVSDLIHRLSDPMVGIPVVIAVAVSTQVASLSPVELTCYTNIALVNPDPIHSRPQRLPQVPRPTPRRALQAVAGTTSRKGQPIRDRA